MGRYSQARRRGGSCAPACPDLAAPTFTAVVVDPDTVACQSDAPPGTPLEWINVIEQGFTENGEFGQSLANVVSDGNLLGNLNPGDGSWFRARVQSVIDGSGCNSPYTAPIQGT